MSLGATPHTLKRLKGEDGPPGGEHSETKEPHLTRCIGIVRRNKVRTQSNPRRRALPIGLRRPTHLPAARPGAVACYRVNQYSDHA